MKKVALGITLLAASALINVAPVSAQDWLNRIDSVMNKVDQTISSGERAQNTADRVMDKIPEQQQEPAPAAQPSRSTQPRNAADQAQMTAAEEEAILQQAREIEERKILEQAERIKKERGYN